MEGMIDRTYSVEGMTCSHCEAAVASEVEQVAGVASIEVDRETGRLRVSGEDFTDAAIKEAVDAAGYELVGMG